MNVVDMDISRKIYKTITLINVGIFTILGYLFWRYLIIDNMEKYEFLYMIKYNIDNIVGINNNRNYFIYIVLFLHTLYSTIVIICLLFTPYIDIYVLNILIVLFVVYTNLEYKGCLLRKYEKIIFKETEQIDPGEFFPDLFFRILSKILKHDFTLNDKVLSVMFIGFILSILILLRFIKLLRKYIDNI